MGMSSNVRLLSLTARMSDNVFCVGQLNNKRMQLAKVGEDLATRRAEMMNQQMFKMNIFQNGSNVSMPVNTSTLKTMQNYRLVHTADNSVVNYNEEEYSESELYEMMMNNELYIEQTVSVSPEEYEALSDAEKQLCMVNETDDGTYYSMWQRFDPSVNSNFLTESDDKAIEASEAEYQAELTKLNNEEKKIDAEISKKETEYKALQTEYEAVKKVLQDNIDGSFGKVFNS